MFKKLITGQLNICDYVIIYTEIILYLLSSCRWSLVVAVSLNQDIVLSTHLLKEISFLTSAPELRVLRHESDETQSSFVFGFAFSESICSQLTASKLSRHQLIHAIRSPDINKVCFNMRRLYISDCYLFFVRKMCTK